MRRCWRSVQDPVGIGRFRKVPFVGCDLSFSSEPAWPMTPITASATQLPMKDKEFDVVLASDMLEHVPPDLRKTVIGECLRVARKLVIFGFPCGQLAWESDRALFNTYLNAGLPAPGWLAEHMEAPFPDTDCVPGLEGWEIQRIGNESIRFHSWMMAREMSGKFVRASIARHAGGAVSCGSSASQGGPLPFLSADLRAIQRDATKIPKNVHIAQLTQPDTREFETARRTRQLFARSGSDCRRVSVLIGLFLVRSLSVNAYAQFGLALGFQATASTLMDLGVCQHDRPPGR